ncbi:hypothetical protein J7F03_21350 [Streptomyces sp. ISL-43]|uniref:hypothetical protein n=1 Tax=Streptomyces sp. ISL-43 TaxID=2819183 RepID=UPI001BE6937F|nr:hypothetical protein [Streptomyces sp. ISL-43]MBT2449583.1 hypothetical protein [Streptomyces sp. ISL-43]
MSEAWVTGLVKGILYNALYHSGGSDLDDDLARRYAHAMRVEPISREPLHRQAAGLRAAVASDEVLTSTFEPYAGQRPFREAEFRDFLTRIADELDLLPVPDEPALTRLPDGPDAKRPRGLRAFLRRVR